MQDPASDVPPSMAPESPVSVESTKRRQRPKSAPKYQPLGLERYIPLGSFVFSRGVLEGEAQDGRELETKPSLVMPKHPALAKHLDTLWSHSWIRIFILQKLTSDNVTMRIYLLPDDVGRALIPRDDKRARTSLKAIIGALDNTASSWNGEKEASSSPSHYESVCTEQDSLFYIFNTMQSPNPNPSRVNNSHAAIAMDDILGDSKEYLGLKTQLFAYQKRSAAMMIQRESQPTLRMDPRLEVLRAPTGVEFYFDRIATQVLSEQRSYEETRGGILGETMGHGKTLISLAVILATKGHLSQVPPEYQSKLTSKSAQRTTPGAASLKELAAATIYRNAIPWKHFFHDLEKRGEYAEACAKFMERNVSWYSIPKLQHSARQRESQQCEYGEKPIYLSSTTLLIVPPNMMSHWQQEIETHLEPGSLSILVLHDNDQDMPEVEELLKQDVILMSKTRFEDELSPRQPPFMKRAVEPTDPDNMTRCVCSQTRRSCRFHVYRSAMLDMHFLRLIVDEGHSFASSGLSNKATFGLKSIHVERKWIISGTPSKGLIGVEIDMATDETVDGQVEKTSAQRQMEILSKRKGRPAAEIEQKDLAVLGQAVTNFFGLQPWANSKSGQDSASWQSYLSPDKSGYRKAGNLRTVLESLVVRHQMNEIEQDLELPHLSNRIVYLDPCFSDKLSLNLFVLSLTANAVTSERTDQDYMFHPKNRHQLDMLLKNLRHAGFHWTGFSCKDIFEAVRISREYLQKPEHIIPEDDRRLLEESMAAGETALASLAWQAFAEQQEVGLYVDGFPEEMRDKWSMTVAGHRDPLLIGATHLFKTQTSIEPDLYGSHPFRSLMLREGEEMWRAKAASVGAGQSEQPKSTSTLSKVVPKSSYEPQRLNTHQINANRSKKRRNSMSSGARSPVKNGGGRTGGLKSALKSAGDRLRPLPEAYEAISKPHLMGTSSAKLSYLLDQVMEFHQDEKILIFYEGDHIAYYIAQALEVLQVEHRIYASGLKVEMRSRYLETFNKGDEVRVMLMDLKQASHGLHVASASRVYFVNPVWNPSVEAQAIKRAHRIGQTRPVYVETLVLRGTLEDQMLQRRKNMTTQEHQKASKSPLDDMRMCDIIKDARFLEVSGYDAQDERSQLAPLKRRYQLYGREFLNHSQVREARDKALGSESTSASGKRVAETQPVEPDGGPSKRSVGFSGSLDKPRTWQMLPLGNAPPAVSASKPSRKGGVMFADDDGVSVAKVARFSEEHGESSRPAGEASLAGSSSTLKRKVGFGDEQEGAAKAKAIKFAN